MVPVPRTGDARSAGHSARRPPLSPSRTSSDRRRALPANASVCGASPRNGSWRPYPSCADAYGDHTRPPSAGRGPGRRYRCRRLPRRNTSPEIVDTDLWVRETPFGREATSSHHECGRSPSVDAERGCPGRTRTPRGRGHLAPPGARRGGLRPAGQGRGLCRPAGRLHRHHPWRPRAYRGHDPPRQPRPHRHGRHSHQASPRGDPVTPARSPRDSRRGPLRLPTRRAPGRRSPGSGLPRHRAQHGDP